MTAASRPPTLGAALAGRYRIEGELGRGGMAAVYLAHDLKHDRHVAIKVLDPSLGAAIGPDRFLREIGIAAALQHPHIVPLFDSGRAGDRLYYVMAFVDGGSLRERLDREGPLPPREAIHLAREIAAGLHHAHERGVIHRDVKPANILLSAGRAMIADFGIARPLGHGPASATGEMVIGTPTYMSPEQASGDPHVDGRSDVYSLGCVLYEMVTGRPPFTGTPQEILARHVDGAPPSLRARRADLEAGLDRTIRRALAKDPSDRFQTAAALAQALEALLESPAPARRRLGAPRLAAAVAIAAIVLAIGLRGWLAGSAGSADLQPNVLAIAPFDVVDPTLEVWSEGLADVLSTTLDGAGRLRTVPPSIVVPRWRGPADAASVGTLGRAVHAAFGVYGRVWTAGADSVRLMAGLVDIATGRQLADVELREHRDRIDRLADSLAVRLLARLAQIADLGAVRLHSLGSSSPAAIRAFLQGEGFLRTTAWDSAEAYYRAAIAQDSSFALAWKRLGEVLGWFVGRPGRPEAVFRAAALNRGLAPRESLLIVIDSLDVAVLRTGGYALRLSLLDRLLATTAQAASQYPLDPGAWFRLGDVRWHWGPFVELPEADGLEAMHRAVELDSAYAPAYAHLIEWELQQGPPGPATAAYLALKPTGSRSTAVRLAADVARRSARGDPGVPRLDTLDPQTEAQILYLSRRGLELDSLAVAGLRRRVERAPPDEDGWRRAGLAWQLAYRGRAREVLDAIPVASPPLFAELAAIGAIPDDRAASEFASWLTRQREGGNSAYHAMHWWLEHGDTTSLRSIMDADSALLGRPADSARFEPARYRIEVASAYLSLLRGDTAAALARLEPLRGWPAVGAGHERLVRARVLAATGRLEEAGRRLQAAFEVPDGPPRPLEVLWLLERARVNQRLGIHSRAERDYAIMHRLWRGADSTVRSAFIDSADPVR